MRTRYVGLLLIVAVTAGCMSSATSSESPGQSAGTASPTERAAPTPTGSPVAATVSGQDFELSLTADRQAYTEDEPITVEAVLTYVGPLAEAAIHGSGSGPIGFSVERLEDGLNPAGSGPISTSDCRPSRFVKDEPVVYQFQKSGGFSADDPNAAIIQAYLNDPLLRLPPGTWRIRADAAGFLGPDPCAGPQLSLRAEVEVTVEPGS